MLGFLCNPRSHLILACGALTSCATSYFVDPVATPVFTTPWQGEVQGSIASHNKIYLEGACALPFNIAIVATRENWAHGLDNDQEMTSLALGHFWPSIDSEQTILAFAGFGAGFHRTGPNFSYNFSGPPLQAPSVQTLQAVHEIVSQTLTGSSDFRKYFVEFEYAYSPGKNGSFGLASRLEYLDQYRFDQTIDQRISDSTITRDTTFTLDNTPKHTLSLDLVAFGSIGISFLQLYGQLLVSLPLHGIYGNWDWDVFVATAGIRVLF
jgi:hypothetical protein